MAGLPATSMPTVPPGAGRIRTARRQVTKLAVTSGGIPVDAFAQHCEQLVCVAVGVGIERPVMRQFSATDPS